MINSKSANFENLEKVCKQLFLKGAFIFMLLSIHKIEAQITGFVFVDENKNGKFDSNEWKVQGANIRVYSYDPKTTHHPLQVSVFTDKLGNYNVNPIAFPVKVELVLDPTPFPLTPGKGFIKLPEKELYPHPGIIFDKAGSYQFALPVSISY